MQQAFCSLQQCWHQWTQLMMRQILLSQFLTHTDVTYKSWGCVLRLSTLKYSCMVAIRNLLAAIHVAHPCLSFVRAYAVCCVVLADHIRLAIYNRQSCIASELCSTCSVVLHYLMLHGCGDYMWFAWKWPKTYTPKAGSHEHPHKTTSIQGDPHKSSDVCIAENVQYAVLDEADKMLSLGLQPQLKRIRALLIPRKNKSQEQGVGVLVKPHIKRKRPQVGTHQLQSSVTCWNTSFSAVSRVTQTWWIACRRRGCAQEQNTKRSK